MNLTHAVLVGFCIGLPPPCLAASPLPTPWDFSQAPVLDGEQAVADRTQTLHTPLTLNSDSALDITAGHTLTFTAPIQGGAYDPLNPLASMTRLFKLGDGQLALQAPSTRVGNTYLLRGSLALAADGALGAESNQLNQRAGTRLDLADGLTVAQQIAVIPTDPTALLNPGWTLTPAPADPAATWRVAAGTATLAGFNTIEAPVIKDGAGTLRLTGTSFNLSGDTLTVRQGGLQVDGAWSQGGIVTAPGTVLSGQGYIDQARVAGHLRPGTPKATGTLLFDQSLQLEPTAQTRIRIDAQGQADQIKAWGTARLGGTLQVQPTASAWTPQSRWTIVQAEGGLATGPAATPDDVAGDGRFTQTASTLPYLSPVLTYTPTEVWLQLRYNRQGLNQADGAWRSALLEDSRFVRESALAHAAHGGAWVQTWGANAWRPEGDEHPADDRDTGGLQIGVSRPIGHKADTHLAAFAGVQTMDLSSRPAGHPGAPQPFGARDTAAHAGLAISHHLPGWDLGAGAAHAWHHARVNRQPDAQEAPLRTRPRAQLTQLWGEARPQPLALAPDTHLASYARLAWLRLHRPGLQEQGSLAAVTLPGQTDQRWVSHLGLQARHRWPTRHGHATAIADLGVQSLWGNRNVDSPQAYAADPAQWFNAQSPALARHTATLNLGVHAPIARRTRLQLAYTGQYSRHQQQHGVWLGTGITF